MWSVLGTNLGTMAPAMASTDLWLSLTAIANTVLQIDHAAQNEEMSCGIIPTSLNILNASTRELPKGLISDQIRDWMQHGFDMRPSSIPKIVREYRALFTRTDWFLPACPGVPLHHQQEDDGQTLRYAGIDITGLKENVSQQDISCVTLSGYRVAEERALIHALDPRSKYRVALVPGFTGTGKSDHVKIHVMDILASRGFNIFSIRFADVEDAFEAIRNNTRDKNGGDVLILDEIPRLSPSRRKILRRLIGAHLRKKMAEEGRKRSIALIGGGDYGTDIQRFLLGQLIEQLALASEVVIVPLHLKPLNFIQAKEFLTVANAWLSEDEKNIYTQFVLNHLPAFLRILKDYRLEAATKSLPEALKNFVQALGRKEFDEYTLARVLRSAQVFPEGGTHYHPITPALKSIITSAPRNLARQLKDL